MANIERGEVEVVVNETAYTLKLSMNAAAVAQSRHKKTIGKVIEEAANFDATMIIALVWVLLQKHHAADFKDEKTVGDFIDDAGGPRVFFDAIEQLNATHGKAVSDPNGTAQGSGTGTNSLSAPDGSA